MLLPLYVISTVKHGGSSMALWGCASSAEKLLEVGHKRTTRAAVNWFRSKSIHVSEWPSKSPELSPAENLHQDLNTPGHRRSPFNLNETELFWKEQWAKLSVSRCGKDLIQGDWIHIYVTFFQYLFYLRHFESNPSFSFSIRPSAIPTKYIKACGGSP